jgi:cardiolipin synthase
MRYDYEINAIIIDPKTTNQLEDKFLEDTQKCDFMSEEEWKKTLTTWKKFKGWFGHLLTFLI